MGGLHTAKAAVASQVFFPLPLVRIPAFSLLEEEGSRHSLGVKFFFLEGKVSWQEVSLHDFGGRSVSLVLWPGFRTSELEEEEGHALSLGGKVRQMLNWAWNGCATSAENENGGWRLKAQVEK